MTPEAALCSAYLEEAEEYELGLMSLKRAAELLAGGESSEQQIQQLLQCFERVADIETRISSAKDSWIQSAIEPGADLRNAVVRVRTLLESLDQQTSTLEVSASALRDRLLPLMESTVQGHRMKQAYSVSSQANRTR